MVLVELFWTGLPITEWTVIVFLVNFKIYTINIGLLPPEKLTRQFLILYVYVTYRLNMDFFLHI